MSDILITEEYRKLNADLHCTDASYGKSGGKRETQVREFCRELDCRQILDYGCGKGALGLLMRPDYIVHEYDPAIPKRKTVPISTVPVVVCLDVMEHLEIMCLHTVLRHIRSLATKGVFFAICLKQGTRKLPDGTHCHRIVRNAQWWVDKLAPFFGEETGIVNIEHTTKDLVYTWKLK